MFSIAEMDGITIVEVEGELIVGNRQQLKEKVLATFDGDALEDLYLPYKPKRRTRAQKAREAGLVTQPASSQNPAGMCNCCGDCCGPLSALNRHPKPADIVFSNYFAQVDGEACTGCRLCEERCQMGAVVFTTDDCADIDLDRTLVTAAVLVADAVLAVDPAAVVRSLCEEYGVDLIVVGLPTSLSGHEGPSAEAARAFGTIVSEATELPLVYQDERFTTVTAEAALLEGGVRRP